MSIETSHKDCDTCNWLALDAGQSAAEYGSDTWLATDADHYARYEKGTEPLGRLGKPARPEPQDADRFLAVLDRLAEVRKEKAEALREAARAILMDSFDASVADRLADAGYTEYAEDEDGGLTWVSAPLSEVLLIVRTCATEYETGEDA